eukprot:4807173-Pleurochrysis_carterae.AAC.1
MAASVGPSKVSLFRTDLTNVQAKAGTSQNKNVCTPDKYIPQQKVDKSVVSEEYQGSRGLGRESHSVGYRMLAAVYPSLTPRHQLLPR